MEVFMEIRVHSLKFDADQKLLDFIEKKVSKSAVSMTPLPMWKLCFLFLRSMRTRM